MSSNTYRIDRWDDHEIITSPVEFACARYTLRIGREEKSVTGLRLRTSKEGMCKDFKAEIHLRLVAGHEVYSQLSTRRKAALKGLLQAPGLRDSNNAP